MSANHGTRLALDSGWERCTRPEVADDHLVVVQRTHPTLAIAWIDHHGDPVMVELSEGQTAYRRPPDRVGGWLKTQRELLSRGLDDALLGEHLRGFGTWR